MGDVIGVFGLDSDVEFVQDVGGGADYGRDIVGRRQSTLLPFDIKGQTFSITVSYATHERHPRTEEGLQEARLVVSLSPAQEWRHRSGRGLGDELNSTGS